MAMFLKTSGSFHLLVTSEMFLAMSGCVAKLTSSLASKSQMFDKRVCYFIWP